MLAPRLGQRVSHIVATILIATMYACASDSQQAEEIVETQQEDSASPATVEDGNSSEVNVVTSNENNQNAESLAETAPESNAEASGFAPNSNANTAKVDADGFVVDGDDSKVDSKISASAVGDGAESADHAQNTVPTDAQDVVSSGDEKSGVTQAAEPSTPAEVSHVDSQATSQKGSSSGKNSSSQKLGNAGSSSTPDSNQAMKKSEKQFDRPSSSGSADHKAGDSFVYTVKKGDTLSHISQEVYGRVSRWKKIAEYNNITNAELIFPGQKIAIPKLSDQPSRVAAKTSSKGAFGAAKPVGTAKDGEVSGALKKVVKAEARKVEQPKSEKAAKAEKAEKAEKSATIQDDLTSPAKLNAAGVIWEKKGDYSRVTPDGFATITVKPGFSITKIAEIMFGDGDQWRKVLEFNNLDISEPNRLFVGQRINFKVPVNPSQNSMAH